MAGMEYVKIVRDKYNNQYITLLSLKENIHQQNVFNMMFLRGGTGICRT